MASENHLIAIKGGIRAQVLAGNVMQRLNSPIAPRPLFFHRIRR